MKRGGMRFLPFVRDLTLTKINRGLTASRARNEEPAERFCSSIRSQESRMSTQRKFALVTGASSGIGYYLAKECAEHGCDLLMAADEPKIDKAAENLRAFGSEVKTVQADLAETDGVDKLLAAANGRPIDYLLANAGRGLGRAFVE